MAKQAKFLVATDSRFPLTVALAHAFAANQISSELLAARKKELVELVSEAAKTFGFQSKTRRQILIVEERLEKNIAVLLANLVPVGQ